MSKISVVATILTVISIVLFPGAPGASTGPASSGGLVWETEEQTDKVGRVYRTGEVTVPEDRGATDSNPVTLPVKHFLATGSDPLQPIFFLSGGPGQSNMDYRPPLALLVNHDVILVGFRGVDGSVVLDCAEVERALVDTDGDLLSEASKRAFTESVMACAARLTAEGVDLAGYTMTAVVDDLEEVRARMGLETINLLSGSYGTRLAQIYAARYSDALRRSMMIGVNPPGRMVWDAATTDDKVAIWSRICADDADCSRRTDNLTETMRAVLAEMPESWMGLTIDPGKVKVTLFCFLFHIDSAALALDSILAAAEGDFSGLAMMSLAYDRMLPPMMVWGDFVAKGGTSGDFLGEAPRFDPPGTVLGSPLSELIYDAAQRWPVPPIEEEYRTVRESRVPTLLVGGDLDVSTPMEHARRQLLPSLVNGSELTLKNLGHVADVMYLYPEARDRLMTGFFDTGEVQVDFPATPPNLKPKWGLPRIVSVVMMALGVLLILIATLLLVLFRWWRRRRWLRQSPAHLRP